MTHTHLNSLFCSIARIFDSSRRGFSCCCLRFASLLCFWRGVIDLARRRNGVVDVANVVDALTNCAWGQHWHMAVCNQVFGFF